MLDDDNKIYETVTVTVTFNDGGRREVSEVTYTFDGGEVEMGRKLMHRAAEKAMSTFES